MMIIARLLFAHLPQLLRPLTQAAAGMAAAIFGLVLATLPAPGLAGDPSAYQASDQTATVRALVMVEQRGCEWCKRWNAEIAPIYPKTREGKFAPLRRADLRAIPDDIILARRVTFTPTFLIVKDGRELARLEGYPGEDFFWPLLTQLLQRHLGFTPPSHPQPKT